MLSSRALLLLTPRRADLPPSISPYNALSSKPSPKLTNRPKSDYTQTPPPTGMTTTLPRKNEDALSICAIIRTRSRLAAKPRPWSGKKSGQRPDPNALRFPLNVRLHSVLVKVRVLPDENKQPEERQDPLFVKKLTGSQYSFEEQPYFSEASSPENTLHSSRSNQHHYHRSPVIYEIEPPRLLKTRSE